MSLQVWLPLTGDLHNQGLADVSITNTSAVVNNSGKIGKCYSFGIAKSYLKFDNVDFMHNFSECSISLWINILTWNTSYATYFQFGLGSTPWAHYIFSLLRNNAASTLCFTISNGSSATNANCLTPEITLNTWYHLTFTYANGHCKIYVNGQNTKDYTTTIVPNFAGITSGIIGACNNGSNYQTNCLMNDFRIYDHALSDKEVEEIAKGLVLHYKLDNDGLGNKNILPISMNLTKWSKESGVSVEWDSNKNMYKIITTGKTSSRWGIYQNITLTANTTYTFSVDGMKVDQACAFGFAEGNAWPSNAGSFTTDRQRLSKTITVGSADAICRIYLNVTCINGGTNNAYFALPKLEVGDVATDWSPAAVDGLTTDNIVYDSSGYQNNGIIIGNINLFTDTSRYTMSTSMNNTGTTNHIECNNELTLPTDVITVSLWVKANKSTNQVIFAHPQIEFGLLNSLGYCLPNANAAGWTLTNFISDQWNHIVAIRQNTTFKLYVNGVLEVQNGANNNYIHNKNVLWLLNREYNSSYAGNASISDFRIYATALTAEQVLDLYHTSASIDKEGNVYARELVEE